MLEVKINSPIIWYYVPKGGYGFGVRVLAWVLGGGPKRYRIRVYKDNESIEKFVKFDSLRAPSDEEMTLINQLEKKYVASSSSKESL